MSIILWILQFLIGLLFIFAGVMKFVTPVEEMNSQSPVVLPGVFLLFIGACEVLGGLGLLLPSLFRIRPALTPLAAVGLAILMVGATVIGLMGPMKAAAAFPFIIGLLCIFIAYGRSRLKPISGR